MGHYRKGHFRRDGKWISGHYVTTFGRKMKIFYFKILNSPGIEPYQDHSRKKNFQRIAFMKTE